jgi:TonB family protein
MRCQVRLLLIASTCLGVSAAAVGADLPEAGGAALLSAASAKVDIRQNGSPPFRLVAHVKVWGEFRGTSEGSLTLTWMSPGEYREELVLPAWRETRLVHAGKLQIARVPDCDPPRAAWPLGMLDFQLDSALQEGDRAMKPRSRGKRLACIQVRQPDLDVVTQCVGTGTGLVERIEYGTSVLEYSDFAPWGSHVFPRTLEWREGRIIAVEMKIDSLAAPPEGGLDATPLPGASEWEHAADWTRPVRLKAPIDFPSVAVEAEKSGEVHVAGTIDADGKPKDLRVSCASPFKDLDKITQAAVGRWIWRPATSGGKPVASELRQTVDYRLVLLWPG